MSPEGTSTGAIRREASDLLHLERVVTAGVPAREAQAFLTRHLVNPVQVRLVEAERGESPEVVRCIEIVHATGQQTWVRAVRTLPDGAPAGAFAPSRRVHTSARIEGSAAASRSIEASDTIILHVPVQSLLRHLPAVYQGAGATSGPNAEQTDALRRLLLIFQHVQRTVTDQIEDLPQLTDPRHVPEDLLAWLASWVGFELDGSLPIHQQRELLGRAIRLVRTRGTRAGIEEMVRVLTMAPAHIEERRPPATFVLGKARLAGGATLEQRYRNREGPGAYISRSGPFPPTRYFTLRLEPRARFAERFGERAPEILRRIVRIVSAERPGHVRFVVRFDELE